MKLSTTEVQRVVLYLRCSTGKVEQEESTEQQLAELKAYANKHSLQIVRSYEDDGISGVQTADIRPGFQALLADLTSGDFDHILVWDLSRLTRSKPRKAIVELDPIHEAGIGIISSKNGLIDPDDIADLIREAMEHEKNSKYSEDLSRNVVRGMRARAEKGDWLWPAPFGFELVEVEQFVDARGKAKSRKRLAPKPGESQAVIAIFEHYVGGGSIRSARTLLASLGYETTPHGVKSILNNVAACGHSSSFNRDRSKFSTGASQPIFVENTHEALVTEQLFDRVQKLLAINRGSTQPKIENRLYVLSGLIKCDVCGYSMGGQYDPIYERYYYRCKGVEYGKGCASYSVREPVVLDAIFATLDERFDSTTLERIEKAIRKQARGNKKTVNRNATEAALVKLRAEYGSAQRKLPMIHDDNLEVFQEFLDTTRQKINVLERTLATITEPVEDLVERELAATREAISYLSELKKRFKKASRPAQRVMLQELIASIRIKSIAEPKGKTRKHTMVDGEIILRSSSKLVMDGHPKGTSSSDRLTLKMAV